MQIVKDARIKKHPLLDYLKKLSKNDQISGGIFSKNITNSLHLKGLFLPDQKKHFYNLIGVLKARKGLTSMNFYHTAVEHSNNTLVENIKVTTGYLKREMLIVGINVDNKYLTSLYASSS